jgi:hypothetical protein
LFALGLLPLVNAPFDWASLGLTRYLLRKNLDVRSAWGRLRLSLLDFGVALVALVALALFLVLAIEVFNAQVRTGLGHDYVDVRAQLLSIQADPWSGGHFWIYFTLFSTLIPTVLHAIIACFSFITLQSWGFRDTLFVGLTQHIDDGFGTRMWLSTLLTLRWVMAIGAVGAGLVLLVWGLFSLAHLGPLFLDGLLWWQAVVS